MHKVPFSRTDHSPIYMFAYVVCPNLDAAAVLSKRRKTYIFNEMNLPNVVVQSEFETVRNELTHSATDHRAHTLGGGQTRGGVGDPLCDWQRRVESGRPPTLWFQCDVHRPELESGKLTKTTR
jgi:hypothetical protein